MKNNLPDHIFEKYATGNCTEEEMALVEAWFLDQLRKDSSRPSDLKIQTAKEEVWKAMMPAKTAKTYFYPWAIAAAVITLLSFAFLFRSDNSSSVITTQETSVKTIQPISKGTVLIASKIENSMMKLQDGTTVILEKGSELTIFPSFNKVKKREVELSGKAFFDVAHDDSKPFIIHSGKVKTTVLGTAFDITSRPNSDRVVVNVIRGRVKVEDSSRRWATILPKNFQVEFFGTEAPRKVRVDAAKELAWNQSDLEFNDISLGDAKSRLEQQFGYKIAIDDALLKKATFSYSMRRKEPMESFMKSICAFIGADYSIDHKNKIISIQPLNQ